MSSLRIVFTRQASRLAVVAALLISAVLPALTPVFASAAQVTDRSIALSSTTANAPGVTYEVKFTATQAAGAVVIDFCNDSPLLGATCTPPSGFDVSGATTSGGFTKVGGDTSASKITLTGTVNAGATTIDLTGVHNPTSAGPLYARIVTYTDGTGAHGYTSTAPGTHLDDGGVAVSITPSIGVSGAVLETMTFCAAKVVLTANCGNAVGNEPITKLGNVVGNETVLDSQNVYTGNVYTQISTNAASGAIVYLKSDTVGCGGLSRAGAASMAAGCGILPANATNGFDITSGQAKFGVKTGTAAGVGSSNGTIRAFDSGSGPYYNNTAYKLNYVSGDASGVTSTYGDPLLDTNGAPVNNMGMPLTFGASAANNTPAGSYSANLSLIATGKF